MEEITISVAENAVIEVINHDENTAWVRWYLPDWSDNGNVELPNGNNYTLKGRKGDKVTLKVKPKYVEKTDEEKFQIANDIEFYDACLNFMDGGKSLNTIGDRVRLIETLEKSGFTITKLKKIN